jgi:hypothetical protein
MEQRESEMFFQRAHLLRDRSLRDAQFLGGGAEAQPAASDLESPQGVQRGQFASRGDH